MQEKIANTTSSMAFGGSASSLKPKVTPPPTTKTAPDQPGAELQVLSIPLVSAPGEMWWESSFLHNQSDAVLADASSFQGAIKLDDLCILQSTGLLQLQIHSGAIEILKENTFS